MKAELTARRRERIHQVLVRRHDDVVMVIENVHDPHNASAILRSCDAFGIGRVALVYTNQVFPEISRGVAAQVQKWLQIDHYDSAEACVRALRSEGICVYATALTDGSCDYLDADLAGPCAIVVGNEHDGCSPEMVALADASIMIPMVGFVQSLNVSVAAAVLMSEMARQRRGVAPGWSEAKSASEQYWVSRETEPA